MAAHMMTGPLTPCRGRCPKNALDPKMKFLHATYLMVSKAMVWLGPFVGPVHLWSQVVCQNGLVCRRHYKMKEPSLDAVMTSLAGWSWCRNLCLLRNLQIRSEPGVARFSDPRPRSGLLCRFLLFFPGRLRALHSPPVAVSVASHSARLAFFSDEPTTSSLYHSKKTYRQARGSTGGRASHQTTVHLHTLYTFGTYLQR